MSDKKILITGGCGFIGSNLAEEFSKDSEVTIIDNLSTGKKENIAGLDARFVKGDICNLKFLKKEFKSNDYDYVSHQAALPSVERSVKNPLSSNKANTTGTLNVLIAARDCGVKRVVYASSSSVYGNSKTLPKREDMETNPVSPYAVSKLAGEHYCKSFFEVYGLETVALRYFNVFGPKQNVKSRYAAAIPIFINAVLKGKSPVIFGDGLQTRDFTSVRNVVEANKLACRCKNIGGKVFNIACGRRIKLIEVINKINKILNKNVKPVYFDARLGDVKHSMADITLAKKFLNYSNKNSFEKGLKETMDWFKNHLKEG